jgi:penicillin amidase
MPSSWYATGLHFGDLDAVGYSFVGAPGIMIGHNQQIAWGITDLVGDVQDFYTEKLDDPAHPQRYEFQGKWRDLDKVTEIIEVKGQSPVTLEVQSTHHGPLISNLGGRFKYPQPLALAWTGNKCETAVGAVLALNRAKDWNEFRAALGLWDGPDMNFLYADRNGNIGYQATGRIPVRSANHQGTIPVPGWTGEYEWKGFIPSAELPSELNPSTGMIVAANQKVVSNRYRYHLGYEFADPFRAIRIQQLLSASARLSEEDMKKFQADDYNLPAKELTPYLATVKPANDLEDKALAEVRSWDFHCSINETAPAIFQTWYRFLVKDTVGDELGPQLTDKYMEYYWVHVPVMINLLKQPNHSLFDDTRTPQIETRDDIVQRSFHDAVDWLRKRYGTDPKQWNWGKMHTVTFSHRPLGLAQIPILSKLFNSGPLPDPGCDRFTVNSAWFALDDPEHPFIVDGGTSQRIVMDLSSWDKTQAVNSTGQSEHLFHPHREDELALWKNMQYHSMSFTRKAVESDLASTLKLVPAEKRESRALAGNEGGNQR